MVFFTEETLPAMTEDTENDGNAKMSPRVATNASADSFKKAGGLVFKTTYG